MKLKNIQTGHTLATTVEIMDTPAKRAIGLLKYSEAPRHYAAVFPLPLNGFFPLVHTLGMKFPIDICFCDIDRKIIFKRSQVGAGRFVLPWLNFFGGARYLIEFANCDLKETHAGEILEWSESA